MQYIVLDLEWNQSSTGKDLVKEIPFEIVEIGAVKLNENREMVDEFSELIKPQVYHQMHRITSKLIHLQMKQLQSGDLFQNVYQRFIQWCGEDVIFCSWGPLDLTELQRNIHYYHLEPISNGPLKFLDIQKLFSFEFEDRKSRKSLEDAVDFLQIEKDIPFHRAFSDAYYTAKVLARLKAKYLKYYSYNCYMLPKTKDDELHVVFEDYSKYISRIFPDKNAAMTDKEVISTRCYLCGKENKKKIRWFRGSSSNYLAVSYCNEHGFMKSKTRIKKAEAGGVYVMKTNRFITKEEMEVVKQSAEKVKEQKKQFLLNQAGKMTETKE